MHAARLILLLVAACTVGGSAARVMAQPAAPVAWPTEVRLGTGRITLDYAALGGPGELRLDSARIRPERSGQRLELRGALGAGFPLSGPIAVDVLLGRRGERIVADDLRLTVAGSTATGRLEFLPGSPPRLDAVLEVDSVVVRDAAGSGSAASGSRQGSVFSSEPLPRPPLDRLDLELSLHLGEVTLGERVRLHDLHATLLTAGRRARLSADAISFAGSTYQLRAVLDESGADPAVSLALTSEDADLGAFVALWGAPDLFDARGRLKIDVTARGASPRALARSLSGRAAAYFVNGRINADAAAAPVVGMQRFLGLIGAAPRREWVAMPCLVARLDAVDGVIRPEVLLVDTARATTIGEGKVDLREERWALTLRPQPKGLDLSLGIPVRVTGPLGAPRVGLDEAGLAGTVGRLIGTAILFPPALLADAFIGIVPNDPCGQILQRGVDRVAPRQVPGQGVVDGVTQGLRDLFGR